MSEKKPGFSVDDVINESQLKRASKISTPKPETELPVNQPLKVPEITKTPDIKTKLPDTPLQEKTEEPSKKAETPQTESSKEEALRRYNELFKNSAPETAEIKNKEIIGAAKADQSSEKTEAAEKLDKIPEKRPGRIHKEPAAKKSTPVISHTIPDLPKINLQNTDDLGYSPLGKPVHFVADSDEDFQKILRKESSYYYEREEPEDSENEEKMESENFFEASMQSYELDIDEYSSLEDKKKSALELQKIQRDTTVSLLVTGVCALLSIAFSLFGVTAFSLGKTVFCAVNIILLVVSATVCGKEFIKGLHGLFTLSSTHYSAVSIATIAVFAQCVLMLFSKTDLAVSSLYVFTPLVILSCFCNTLGRTFMLSRISKNFLFLTSSEKKYAVDLIAENSDAVKIAGDYIERQPLVAFQKSSNFYSGFMKYSVKSDPARFISQITAPVGLIASLILFTASFIMFKDFEAAFISFTASLCIFIPFSALLCVNIPMSALSSLARKWGGMISGYPAVDKFSRTNIIMIDAEDLFPKGSIELKNIKTFQDANAKEAVLYAAALINCFGGPVSEVFEQVIKDRVDLLPEILEPEFNEGLGLSGWAEGLRILVGNRKFMVNNSVNMPPRDIETSYLQKGYQLLYISVGGAVSALLILSYSADSRRAAELSRLEKNGYTLAVRTGDILITSGLISSRFGIDDRMIRILPHKLTKLYADNAETVSPTAPALILTKGRMTTMLRLLCACGVQKNNIAFAVILQFVAIILGFLFIAFIVCYSGTAQLKAGALLLYQLFWLIAIAVLPKIRKP